MSTFDYTRSVATATRLIARFGAAGAIRRTSTSGGNAWDPSSGTATTTDYTATMVLTDYSAQDVNGQSVLQTDRRVLVSTDGLSVVPASTDSLVGPDGQVLQIINVRPLKPAGTVILYDIQARQA